MRYMSKRKRKGAITNGGSVRRRKMLARVAKRDQWICQICDRPVMAARIKNHPYAPSLDHIVKHCDGGSDNIDNLQLAHRRCNSEAD